MNVNWNPFKRTQTSGELTSANADAKIVVAVKQCVKDKFKSLAAFNQLLVESRGYATPEGIEKALKELADRNENMATSLQNARADAVLIKSCRQDTLEKFKALLSEYGEVMTDEGLMQAMVIAGEGGAKYELLSNLLTSRLAPAPSSSSSKAPASERFTSDDLGLHTAIIGESSRDVEKYLETPRNFTVEGLDEAIEKGKFLAKDILGWIQLLKSELEQSSSSLSAVSASSSIASALPVDATIKDQLLTACYASDLDFDSFMQDFGAKLTESDIQYVKDLIKGKGLTNRLIVLTRFLRNWFPEYLDSVNAESAKALTKDDSGLHAAIRRGDQASSLCFDNPQAPQGTFTAGGPAEASSSGASASLGSYVEASMPSSLAEPAEALTEDDLGLHAAIARGSVDTGNYLESTRNFTVEGLRQAIEKGTSLSINVVEWIQVLKSGLEQDSSSSSVSASSSGASIEVLTADDRGLLDVVLSDGISFENFMNSHVDFTAEGFRQAIEKLGNRNPERHQRLEQHLQVLASAFSQIREEKIKAPTALDDELMRLVRDNGDLSGVVPGVGYSVKGIKAAIREADRLNNYNACYELNAILNAQYKLPLEPEQRIGSLRCSVLSNQDSQRKITRIEEGKVPSLKGVKFSSWIPIRGDGNCYYRSVLYGRLKQLVTSPERREKLQELASTFQSCEGVDAEKQDQTVRFLRSMANREIANSVEELEECFVLAELDEAMIQVGKHLISNYLIEHQDDIINGMVLKDSILWTYNDCASVKDFCNKYVLPMGMCAEGPFVERGILGDLLGVHINLVMLPRVGEVQGILHQEQPPRPEDLYLLFRPGHYDLLVPEKSGKAGGGGNVLSNVEDIRNYMRRYEGALDSLERLFEEETLRDKKIELRNQLKEYIDRSNQELPKGLKNLEYTSRLTVVQDHVNPVKERAKRMLQAMNDEIAGL